jgi:hypothetical protein
LQNLKGLADMLGAAALASKASACESAVKHGQPPNVVWVDDLELVIQACCAALQAWPAKSVHCRVHKI